MASTIELLAALNNKEEAVSTADLAKGLHASKEGTLKQLTREKDKGNVDGNSQEGWLITEAGRKALGRGEVPPTMLEEEVTPRQQFQAIGRRIGIPEDRIVLATDIVWSGDFNDVKWVWEALGQADIAADLRSVWVNSWRAKLHKAIPPELETELTGVSKAVAEAERGTAPSKLGGREYIIIEDEPVRVGTNLGDYSLQDAKDILTIRALRDRFAGAGQVRGGSQPGATEKVSDVLTALSPYLNKGSDVGTLKEIIADKLELQKQDILSKIPPSGQPTQPKSFIEQITGFVGAIGSLQEAGPILRSILGIPEASSNPSATSYPVSVKGPDGTPIVMDLGTVIDWRKFQSEERRNDERHGMLMGLGQAARENIGTFAEAAKEAIAEAKGEHTGQTPKQEQQEQPHMFKCGTCQKEFGIRPVDWQKLVSEQLPGVTCPHCQSEYTREQVMA